MRYDWFYRLKEEQILKFFHEIINNKNMDIYKIPALQILIEYLYKRAKIFHNYNVIIFILQLVLVYVIILQNEKYHESITKFEEDITRNELYSELKKEQKLLLRATVTCVIVSIPRFIILVYTMMKAKGRYFDCWTFLPDGIFNMLCYSIFGIIYFDQIHHYRHELEENKYLKTRLDKDVHLKKEKVEREELLKILRILFVVLNYFMFLRGLRYLRQY